MNGYETIIVLEPELNESEQTALLDQLKALIAQHGGAVVHQSDWGKRRLAYKVKKHEFGVYHILYLDNHPDALHALEANFRLNERVIKWHSVKVEDTQQEFDAFEKLKTDGSSVADRVEGTQ